MTDALEPSIEDIVARFEKEGGIISLREIDALIASWRKRGEALKARDELIARMWLGSDAVYRFGVATEEEAKRNLVPPDGSRL